MSRSPSRTIKFGWAGGVNLLIDPRALPENLLAGGKNCWPTFEGQLAKRHIVAFERFAISNPSQIYHPIALFEPDPTTGFDFVLHYADSFGNEYIRAVSGNTDTEANSPSIQVASGAPLNYQPMSFANYRGAVIAVGAGNEGFFQLTRGSGSGVWAWHRASFDWTAFETLVGGAVVQIQTIQVKPQAVGVYRDRLAFANFGIGMGNWMVLADRVGPWAFATVADDAHRDNVPLWSQIGSDVLADNGRHIEIAVLAGQNIRRVEEVSTASVANALQSALLVLTESKCNIVTGEIAESTDTGTTYSSYLGDWTPATTNVDAGIAGPHTLCHSPNGTFWASAEDVYALYDGAPKPVIIGTSIRKALSDCPPNLHPFWHMAYADGCVYLSVATQNSSDALNITPQHWRLDVRPVGDGNEVEQPQGPANARWWGPQDYESLPAVATQDISDPGSVGACILGKRFGVNRGTVYGLVMGGVDAFVSPGVMVVSYNKVFGGRDVPYRELATARVWTANELVPVGDPIMPTAAARTGRLYVATVGGTTAGAEPVWPTTDGGVVVDGTVTWTEVLQNLTLNFNWRLPNFLGPLGITPEYISMEPDFKEYNFGTEVQDKVFVRADLSAFLATKCQVLMKVLANGGDLSSQMGPCVLGDFTLGRASAFNDLGIAQLGTSSVAKSFQARQLRPSAVSRDVSNVSGIGIVRGRSLQPKLRIPTGFVIDTTNDYIVWAALDVTGTLRGIAQAKLTDGYYANMDLLMAHIVTVMNAATTAGAILGGGFVVAANPWSSTGIFAAQFPYMNNLKLAFTGRGTILNPSTLVFVGALDPTEAVVFSGVPTYVGRSMRLLAMLGFDTSNAYMTARGFAQLQDDNGVAVNAVGEKSLPALSATPATIHGVQVVPYLNSCEAAFTDIEGTFVLKTGRPLVAGDRQA